MSAILRMILVVASQQIQKKQSGFIQFNNLTNQYLSVKEKICSEELLTDKRL